MAGRAPVLDVRRLSPGARGAEVLRAFDALAPGAALVLIDDLDPGPLLHQLQASRSGRFDWSPLEDGPERFRVALRRRSTEGPASVGEYLGGDHARLDAMLANVARLVAARAFADAGARFAEVVCGLGRHIEAEERILLPALEQAAAAPGGPAMAMRSEHAEIRELAQVVASAIRARDAEHCAKAIRVLAGVLREHGAREEQVLYPAADELAGGDAERRDLVRRLQAV